MVRRVSIDYWMIALLWIFLVSVFPQKALAAPITFIFEGTVTSVHPSLGGTFDTSQSVFGSYTFESTTLDTNPSPFIGHYDNTLTAFTITIGSYIANLDNSGSLKDITIFNDFSGLFDRYSLSANVIGPSVAGQNPIAFAMALFDSTQTALSSEGLPSAPPDPASFDFPDWGFFFSSHPAIIEGKITSLELTPATVPEGTSFFYLIIGALILLGYKRYKPAVQFISFH